MLNKYFTFHSSFYEDISSEPLLILGSQYENILVDSMVMTNKTERPAYIDVYIIREDIETEKVKYIYVAKNKKLGAYETVNLG